MDTSLSIIDSIGKANHKIIAVTETGYEGYQTPHGGREPCCLPWRNIRSLMYWYGETPVKKSLTSLALIPDKPLPRISRSSLKIRKHCSPPISTYINNIIHNQINHVISSCRDGACPVSHHLIISFKAKTSWNNFKKK